MTKLSDNEIVTCFVFGKKKITRPSQKKGSPTITEIIVKPKAFEPSRRTNNLSVSRITDLKSADDNRSIWFIGKVIEKARAAVSEDSSLASRADINISDIFDLKLDVIPSEPPPRHANIENFPPIDAEESSARLQIQQKLADKSEGFLVKEIDHEIDNILDEDVKVKPEFVNYLNSLAS